MLAFGDSITNGGGELQWGVALQSWALWVARGLGLAFTSFALDGNVSLDVNHQQIPAFLSRQTDLIVAAAKTGRVVNIKKGQFLAPDDVAHAITKVTDAGNARVVVTERGTSFGYHNLVVDMRAFPMIRALGVPVIFDVTHSLQLPGGGDGVTAGQAEYIETLASAGVAACVDGVFLEVHDNPPMAKSDAQNALKLDLLEPLLRRLVAIDAIVKQPAPIVNPARSHD